MVMSPWGFPRSGMSGSRNTASLDRMSPLAVCAPAGAPAVATAIAMASVKRIGLSFIAFLASRPAVSKASTRAIFFPSLTSGRAGWGSCFAGALSSEVESVNPGASGRGRLDSGFAQARARPGMTPWKTGGDLRPRVEHAGGAAAVLLLDGVRIDGAQEVRYALVD